MRRRLSFLLLVLGLTGLAAIPGQAAPPHTGSAIPAHPQPATPQPVAPQPAALQPIAPQASAPQAAAPREGFIPAGRLRIHYLEEGRGPALVFLHAGYQDAHMWREQQAHFAKNYRTIAIDLPGQGATTGIDTSLLIEQVLRIALDSLHIDKASVVGISVGASCALDFALAYPGRVDKLVLVSAGLPGAPEAVPLDSLSKKLFEETDSVFQTKDDTAIAANFTRLWCDGPFRQPQKTRQAARAYVLKTTLAQVIRNTTYWPRFNPNPAAKRLSSLQPPVLIIDAALDVPYILAIGRYIHAHTSRSQLIIVPGVAHMVNLEQPRRFDRLLTDFLTPSPRP
ncbi:MAG TPA: alpha/beta hydrolase [Puia sp.]|nr:alpha/beta hydrolase [Puia sp.]